MSTLETEIAAFVQRHGWERGLRKLTIKHHPDRGGCTSASATINERMAWYRAKEETRLRAEKEEEERRLLIDANNRRLQEYHTLLYEDAEANREFERLMAARDAEAAGVNTNATQSKPSRPKKPAQSAKSARPTKPAPPTEPARPTELAPPRKRARPTKRARSTESTRPTESARPFAPKTTSNKSRGPLAYCSAVCEFRQA